ncbi:hypothetical protein SynNOUM97013_02433 [Synechococcus sp. NOUM97013]|nr:hypothetical protein SynNOUM97013_02433 [Synechococcus sp. NOUM97013]
MRGGLDDSFHKACIAVGVASALLRAKAAWQAVRVGGSSRQGFSLELPRSRDRHPSTVTMSLFGL